MLYPWQKYNTHSSHMRNAIHVFLTFQIMENLKAVLELSEHYSEMLILHLLSLHDCSVDSLAGWNGSGLVLPCRLSSSI